MKPILIVEDEAIIRGSLRDWLHEQDLNLQLGDCVNRPNCPFPLKPVLGS